MKITTDELKAERARSHKSLRQCYNRLLKEKLLAKVRAFKSSGTPRDAFVEIMTDIIEELL